MRQILYTRFVIQTLIFASLIVASQSEGELPKNAIVLDSGLSLTGAKTPIDFSKSKYSVILFIAHDCPIANRYVPEIRRIVNEYSKKDVAFTRIYMLETEDADLVEEHTADYELSFPALLDPRKDLVKKCGVRVTPEAVVFDAKGVMKYRGRIDDVNVEHGRVKEDYRRDLRIALDEVLAGKPVSVPSTAAVGCFISGIDD